MANVVLTVLSMTIGFFFMLMGTLKLTPAVNEEVYREMRKVFIRNAKVFPLILQTGFKPNAHLYRKVFGTTEVVCGVLLSVIPGPLKELANIILFLMMCLSTYNHYALGNGMDKMTPDLVFGLLLACRYIVNLQVRAREEKRSKEEAERRARLQAAKKTE